MARSEYKGLRLGYRLQAVGVRLLFVVFGMMSLDRASAFGGWLARSFGPFTRAHRMATLNLHQALRYKKRREIKVIIEAMWDNLGRTLAEYPHLRELMNDPSRIEVIDNTNSLAQMRDRGAGALLIGMQAGNWELSTVPGFRLGLKQHHFYRTPTNPFIERVLAKQRGRMQQAGYLPKGAKGAQQAAFLLKNRGNVCMLVDRKQDDGIALPFFVRDAMTTTAPAAYARRIGAQIIADRVVRLKGARFRIYVESVEVSRTDDRAADIIETTKRINLLVENWIRQYPAQWVWVHRRWPKEN